MPEWSPWRIPWSSTCRASPFETHSSTPRDPSTWPCSHLIPPDYQEKFHATRHPTLPLALKRPFYRASRIFTSFCRPTLVHTIPTSASLSWVTRSRLPWEFLTKPLSRRSCCRPLGCPPLGSTTPQRFCLEERLASFPL